MSPQSTSPGVIIVPVPQNTTVKVTGFTNSGGWTQQIVVTPLGAPASTWTSTGAQDNRVVGQISLAGSATATSITVQMQFNPGDGFQPSTVKAWASEAPGLSGYVIGGQDGGGRPSGPAFWNTLVLIYWAVGY